MKILATFLLPLVFLVVSCKGQSEEGPYGFKVGQVYEFKSAILFVTTPTGDYKIKIHTVTQVGPDWVEFSIGSGERKKYTKEQLSQRLMNYKLISEGQN